MENLIYSGAVYPANKSSKVDQFGGSSLAYMALARPPRVSAPRVESTDGSMTIFEEEEEEEGKKGRRMEVK